MDTDSLTELVERHAEKKEGEWVYFHFAQSSEQQTETVEVIEHCLTANGVIRNKQYSIHTVLRKVDGHNRVKSENLTCNYIAQLSLLS